jgi:HAD superfamily hydrolase (TIGR01509 family)
MHRLKALLWDVDGTLAETERDGHLVAFNMAFDACGLPWRWSESAYGDLLRITGGRERLMFDMSQRADAPPLSERDAVARAIHAKKNALYAALVRSHAIALRGGVQALMQQCRERGVRMGITTTTSRSNVDALLSVNLGPRWADGFAVIVCGEDVQHKKPDPEVYVKALRALDIGPLEAVAIEDSPGGVLAARAANIPVVVTRSTFFATTPIEGAIAIGPGLHDRRGWQPALLTAVGPAQGVGLDDIERWRVQMASTEPGTPPRQAALG